VELRPVLAYGRPGIGGVVEEVVACSEDGGGAATGALSYCWTAATRGKENMVRALVHLGAALSLQGELRRRDDEASVGGDIDRARW